MTTTDPAAQPVHPACATIGDRLSAAKGYTTGFDVLRIVLAVCVLGWHSIYVTYGWDNWLWEGPYRGFPSLILPAFFSLSGFLVAGSFFRTLSLSSFVTLRLLRLVPALFVEVCLSALILGPVVTTLPLRDYLSGHEFLVYWLNILGIIHFELPGVFETNKATGVVNVSLWTVPFELECYLALIGLVIFGLLRRPRVLFWVLIGASIVIPITEYLLVGFMPRLRPPGRLLVLCFLAGVALYVYRDRIRFDRRWFVASLFAAVLLLSRADTAFLAPLPAAYATVYLGLLNLPRIPVLMAGDYSYGIYLYAFPVQQTMVWFDPTRYSWRLRPFAHAWWLNIGFALPVTILVAMLSWHFVEKPVLARRKHVTAFVQKAEANLRNHLRLFSARTFALERSFPKSKRSD